MRKEFLRKIIKVFKESGSIDFKIPALAPSNEQGGIFLFNKFNDGIGIKNHCQYPLKQGETANMIGK